ncbi:hypothetical protein [Actinokineospora globicatena]|uniref:hypothetical protein n=1 Tax=Actinokineospora globicatena TaxID=103729 RepID=UPI0020A261C7|nr:hypothetical protein [Actinokineospora globicatena]
MDPHRQLGQVKQSFEQGSWGLVEVDRQVGQGVDEVQLVEAGLGWLLLLVELVDRSQRRLAFGVEVVVALAKALGEGVTGIGVLGLPPDVVELASDVGHLALEPLVVAGRFVRSPPL